MADLYKPNQIILQIKFITWFNFVNTEFLACDLTCAPVAYFPLFADNS